MGDPEVGVLLPSLPAGFGFFQCILHPIPCNQLCEINNKKGYVIDLDKVKES